MAAKQLKMLIKTGVVLAALALSGAASATVELNGQYRLSSFANQIDDNEYVFTYVVKNLNQTSGGYSGLDGFTIYVPLSAILVSSTHPLPGAGAEHAPGYWSEASSTGLDLGGNGSQNLTAPAGYKAYTWWGGYPESVYTIGKTASFSITLDNVTVGTNTVGISSYFGAGTPPGGQQYAQNQYGNYTTFTTQAVSAVTLVPEPETFAMLLAGLGIMGALVRRKRA